MVKEVISQLKSGEYTVDDGDEIQMLSVINSQMNSSYHEKLESRLIRLDKEVRQQGITDAVDDSDQDPHLTLLRLRASYTNLLNVMRGCLSREEERRLSSD